jgi:hypothetical protein
MWHTWQLLEEDIEKLIDHWHLRSLNSIHLFQLHMISNSLSSHYRLCDKFQFLPIWSSQLDRVLGAVDKHLMLTQLVHFKNDVNAHRFQNCKVGNKVYSPYFKIHLQA